MNNIEKDVLDLLWLISCGVHGTPVDAQRIKGVNEENVHALAVKHGVEQVIAFVLVQAWKECGETQKAQAWERIIRHGMRRTLYFDIEREEILAYFEENGIWYMPLKGVVLKDLYPKDSMRQMTDNDILYDAKYRDKVLAFFEARGYRVERNEKGADDAAYKMPMYNFEMHKTLFIEYSDLYPYYADVRKRLISDGQSRFGLRFTDEDFYVYMVAHAAKHYRLSGHGLRFLLDIFIYLQKMEGKMDWVYISQELSKLKVAGYESVAKAICLKLFSAEGFTQIDSLTPAEKEMLSFVVQSSLFGNMKGYVHQHLSDIQSTGETSLGKAKLIYIVRRLFPNTNEMVFRYPVLEHKQWLLPVYYVRRIVSATLLSSGRYAREFMQTIRVGKK